MLFMNSKAFKINANVTKFEPFSIHLIDFNYHYFCPRRSCFHIKARLYNVLKDVIWFFL